MTLYAHAMSSLLGSFYKLVILSGSSNGLNHTLFIPLGVVSLVVKAFCVGSWGRVLRAVHPRVCDSSVPVTDKVPRGSKVHPREVPSSTKHTLIMFLSAHEAGAIIPHCVRPPHLVFLAFLGS